MVDYDDCPEVPDDEDEVEMELEDPAEAVELVEAAPSMPEKSEEAKIHVIASNTAMHYKEYSYGMDSGKSAVLLNGHPHELIEVDGWKFEDPPQWWHLPKILKDRLPYAMKILRGHALQSVSNIFCLSVKASETASLIAFVDCWSSWPRRGLRCSSVCISAFFAALVLSISAFVVGGCGCPGRRRAARSVQAALTKSFCHTPFDCATALQPGSLTTDPQINLCKCQKTHLIEP